MQIFSDIQWRVTQGPTAYSRRSAVFLQAAAADLQRLARVAPSRGATFEALTAGMAAAGIGTRQLPVAPEATGQGVAPAAASAATIAWLAALLMVEAGSPGRDFGLAASRPGTVSAYWNDWMEGLGLVAGRQAVRLLECAVAGKGDLTPACASALEAVYRGRQDAAHAPMIFAAERRGIPWRPLGERGEFQIYGQGARQEIFLGAMSMRQSRSSVHLIQRRHLSLGVLRAAGLPVAEHIVVTRREAVQAAVTKLGFPLTVRPNAGGRPQDTHRDLTDVAETEAAFDACCAVGPRVLIERQHPGLPYRITLLHGAVVAAARHALPLVRGDGQSSVAQLIDAWNRLHRRPILDPYRPPMAIDVGRTGKRMRAALAQQSMSLQSIPEEGQQVFLDTLPGPHSGGLYENVTERVHPETLALAEEAARILACEDLGLDVITQDVARAPDEAPLVINGVVVAPEPRPHLDVRSRPLDIGEMIFKRTFPANDAGRIPLVASLGDDPFSMLLRRLLTEAGETVGYADGETAEVSGCRLEPSEGKTAHPAFALLRDRRPSCAVVKVAAADAIWRGLPSDRFDVVVAPAKVIEDEDAATLRALDTLASLPGDALVLSAANRADRLPKITAHRRKILVDEAGDFAAQRQAGSLLVSFVRLGGRQHLAVHGDSGTETLGELPDGTASRRSTLWSAAALLGLSYSAATIQSFLDDLRIEEPMASPQSGGRSA